MKKIKIYPSLISADLLNLQTVIQQLEPYCDGFHIDVMDNHFVPNLTWCPQFVNAIACATSKRLFVHLMIRKPKEMLQKLHLRDNDIVSFHIESTSEILETIKQIKEKKLTPSLAICPKTPLESVFEFLHTIDSVLLMSVEPGFSGQQFLKGSIDRLIQLHDEIKKQNVSCAISMDGGITENNIGELVKHGATSFGIASALFSQPDPVVALQELYSAASNIK